MNKCLKNDLFLNVQFIVLEQIFLKKILIHDSIIQFIQK